MGFLLPALNLGKLENQRSVVMNERRQTVDNQPYGRAFERLHELLYPDTHPYHWPVIGYLQDIEAATLDDVTSFFQTFYSPSNAVITLAGDLSIDHAIKQIEHWFGDIPAGIAIPTVETEVQTATSATREVMLDRVELPRIYMAYTLPAYGQPEWYAADLLSAVLSGGKSSPLHEDLVYSRQMATDVSTFVLPTELAATFFVVATARPDTKPEELEAALQNHIAAVAEGTISATNLQRAKNKVVAAFCDELQNLDHLADMLSMFATYFDDPDLMELEVETYLNLQAADLSRFASSYLTPNKCVSLVVIPDDRPEGSQ